MSQVDPLKRKVGEAIDRGGEKAMGIAKRILGCPETGFREFKTSKLVQEAFAGAGIPFTAGIALTGVKGMLNGGGPGPTVAVMGELDSVVCSDHPHADPETGAAHACGHHAQIGMLVAVAHGLSASGVLEQLPGRVALMAVPAEEYIQVEARLKMRQEGKIEFLGGKPEFIRLGAFDDVDMAMLTHTTIDPQFGLLAVGATFNGLLVKEAEFIGRAAHAGALPWKGINALNAATLALSAIHANRETFRDEDFVRVHPILTEGGETVNVVPARARMEMFVRGRNIQAIQDACAKVDRSLRAGALAVGASVRIRTVPGYLPVEPHEALTAVYKANAEALVGRENVGVMPHRAASTDLGDLSHIMPAIHPCVGGVTGVVHGKDYLVGDWQTAILTAAKAMAFTVIDLLADRARLALQVKAESKPKLTKQQYLDLVRSHSNEEVFESPPSGT
jgi:amidohydrolase